MPVLGFTDESTPDLSALDTISPAELMRDVLTRLSDPDLAPAGVIVGPANDVQQQVGIVSCVDAGMPVVELYVPLVSVRSQIRCLSGTLEGADRICRTVQRWLNGRSRLVARQRSTGKRYLIHSINVTAGPSMHFDSAETWETLLFAEVSLSTIPLTWPPA